MLMIGTTELAKALFAVWREERMGYPEVVYVFTWEELDGLGQTTWRRVAERAVDLVATAAGAR